MFYIFLSLIIIIIYIMLFRGYLQYEKQKTAGKSREKSKEKLGKAESREAGEAAEKQGKAEKRRSKEAKNIKC